MSFLGYAERLSNGYKEADFKKTMGGAMPPSLM